MSGLTQGEAIAFIAMITDEPAEAIVGFALVAIIEPLEAAACKCGHPESHRVPHVVSNQADQLLACGILNEGMMQILRVEADAKYGRPS